MNRHQRFVLAVAVQTTSLFLNACDEVDCSSFKSDSETDSCLYRASDTYASMTREIRARQDIRGYRFVNNETVARGTVAVVDGYLEIQLNPRLTGPGRVSTIIFEMANAARNVDHGEIDTAADKGQIGSPEAFGIAHELLEFEAMRLHRQVLTQIAPRSGELPKDFFYLVTPAPRAVDDYRLPPLHLYLKAQIESGHTGHYYDHFLRREALRRPLLGTHPPIDSP
jgi:hypothetical protein